MLHGEPLTIPEAAERLGISIDGVRKRLQRGTLQHYKQGGRVMVLIPDPIVEGAPSLPVLAVEEVKSAAIPYPVLIERLVAQVGTLSERVGKLEAQLLESEAENRALRKTVLKLLREQEA